MAWELFHFLRPAWLLLLLPAGLVTWSILQRQDPMRSWHSGRTRCEAGKR